MGLYRFPCINKQSSYIDKYIEIIKRPWYNILCFNKVVLRIKYVLLHYLAEFI